jgi:hypothetical protein
MHNENELAFLNYYYFELPLYRKISFEESNASEIAVMLFPANLTIDTYCADCKRESTFFCQRKGISLNTGPNPRLDMLGHGGTPDSMISRQCHIMRRAFEAYQRDNSFVNVDYLCVRNQSHKILFVFCLSNNSIEKVGQHPSIATLSFNEIKRYKKLLGDQLFSEYSKCIGLFAHGIGIGSFVYLRRIIENYILKRAYAQAKNQEDWSEEKFLSARILERIQMVKNFLPKIFYENKIIYSILSKGIHELTEDECKSFFSPLRAIIEMSLDEILAEEEKLKKLNFLNKSISGINDAIKNRSVE